MIHASASQHELAQRLSDPGPVSPYVRPRVAVILAAGRSERMSTRTNGSSKVALRLGGLTLLEHNIRALWRAGIERVVVVLGHDADQVARCLSELSSDGLQLLRADGWESGNAASLMAARSAAGDEPLFLVQTADHLFSSGALERLLVAGGPAALIDADPGDAWDGGTRARVVDGRVVALSKSIDDPAIDCGVFLVSPHVFEHFDAQAAREDFSLAGLLTTGAVAQPLTAVVLPAGEWWRDIDTPDDLRTARRVLRRSLSKPTDGPVSRYLNRPLSTRFSMLISRWRISPTLLSMASFAVSVVAAFLLALGEGIAGGLLTQAASVLDGVDGEIARLQFRTSRQGAFLDSILDRVADGAIIAGLGIWAAMQGAPSLAVTILVASAAVLTVLSMATKDRAQLLGLVQHRDNFGSRVLAGRDGRLLIVAIGSLLGRPAIALGVVAATAAAGLLTRVVYVLRSPHEAL
jgi:1L-myo-inositol 1-phosphate cytidylyltransferase / CDP-L-myo-inositol myo-inositolphosphotransferase